MNDTVFHMGVAALIVQLINWMKATKLIPFVNEHSTMITRFISVTAALLTGIGIHFITQGDFSSGGSLQITWPPLDVMLTSFITSVGQWGFQQLLYHAQKAANAPAHGGQP
jgi:hypothetical protein